jgi:hypothetical protein
MNSGNLSGKFLVDHGLYRLPRVLSGVLLAIGAAASWAQSVAPASASASAPAWPTKTIRAIVPFSIGSTVDIIGRIVMEPLSAQLGQQILVENRGGANGNIGGEAVAKSAADGHTLLMSSGGMVSINPHLYTKMPFDPVKDLVPVAAAARVLVFLEVRPGLQINDFKTFARRVRLKLQYDVTILAATAGLANELAFLLHRTADGFAVGDLRLADVGLDLELALHTVDETFEVQFAHSRDQRLPRLLALDGAECRILPLHHLERLGELLSFEARLRLDRHRDHGLRKLNAFEQNRFVGIATKKIHFFFSQKICN